MSNCSVLLITFTVNNLPCLGISHLWPLALVMLYPDRLKSLLSSHFCWLWCRSWPDKKLIESVKYLVLMCVFWSLWVKLVICKDRIELVWQGILVINLYWLTLPVSCYVFISKIPSKSLQYLFFFSLALLSTWQTDVPAVPLMLFEGRHNNRFLPCPVEFPLCSKTRWGWVLTSSEPLSP